jgi:hypothetical protein
MISSQYVKDAQLNQGAAGFLQPLGCIRVPISSRNKY